VQWRRRFENSDGESVLIAVRVGQGSPLDMRRHFLASLLSVSSMPVPLPVSGRDHSLQVGDACAVASELPATDEFHGVIHFIRRNVMVSLFQESDVVDAASLAQRIDTEIQARPLIHKIKQSALLPRILNFKFEAPKTTVLRSIEGEARYEDPSGETPIALVLADLGDTVVAGTSVTYFGQVAGKDTVTLRVANALNLRAEATVKINVSP